MLTRGTQARLTTRTRVRRAGVALAAGLVLAGLVLPVAPAAAARCDKAYSYAGLVSARKAHGVSTTLTAVSAPQVSWGHVAGWVGVGGAGQGPNGTTEWIQVGYSGFYGGEHKLYYEVTQPGKQPKYTPVLDLQPGESHRIGVVEMRDRRNWWRVWVDGRAVSPPIYLPGSHGRWAPVATAESWNAGMGACNGLAYRFAQTRVATRPGGGWAGLRTGQTLQDPGYAVSGGAAGFVSRSRA